MYVQSFYGYPIFVSEIKKGIPSRTASGPMGNIAEFTAEEVDKIKAVPMLAALIRKGKLRILENLPESAKPAAAKLNEAKAEAADARKAAADLAAEIERLKAEIEALQGKASGTAKSSKKK